MAAKVNKDRDKHFAPKRKDCVINKGLRGNSF